MEAVAEAGLDDAERSDRADWVAAIRAGDFDRAWAITDADLARHSGSQLPKHQGPRHLQGIWRGEELRGRRVLVRCYHGLGDTIQFIRFMRPLREIAPHVTVWCQPELLSLVAGAAGVDRMLALHEGAPQVDYDVDIEIMEVPHAIRVGRDQICPPVPYLNVPVSSGDDALPASPNRFSVGLVWETGDWDKRRSISPALLHNLRAPGLQLCSLQRGPAAAAASEFGAIDVSTPGIDGLARRMRTLDLVLTVDTMVAHLAGALGLNTWIMLHADCDWRWPSTGERTFWYPTARLFHQRTAGDWAAVMRNVRSALLEEMQRDRAL